jgi:hypothetical protein
VAKPVLNKELEKAYLSAKFLSCCILCWKGVVLLASAAVPQTAKADTDMRATMSIAAVACLRSVLLYLLSSGVSGEGI